MTSNQVAYWQLQEAKRHNTVAESNEQQRNKAQADRWTNQSRIESGKLQVDQGMLNVSERQQATREKEADTNRLKAETGIASAFVNAAKLFV